MLQFLRTWAVRLPSWLNYEFYKYKNFRSETDKLPLIYDIPLGYGKQVNLPIKNIEERLYEVAFIGSVVHKTYLVGSFKRWFKNPKNISRNKMVFHLNKFKEKYPKC